MNKIPSRFRPADKMLQDQSCNLITGYETVKTTIIVVWKLRNDLR